MLTSGDTPTIRFAIRRRLDQERDAYVFEPILCQPYARGEWFTDKNTGLLCLVGEPFIRVGVLIELGRGKTIIVRSQFDLPDPFEHGHLLNEVDEIAEALKKARKGHKVNGTGMRGNWGRYGTLMARQG